MVQPAPLQRQQSFKPLEYWKPPKPVRHQSTRVSSPKKEAHSSVTEIQDPEKQELEIELQKEEAERNITFVTTGEMNGLKKNMAGDQVRLADGYGGQYQDGGAASRWNPKSWGKKAWAILVGIVVIIIVIVVVVAVVVSRNNRYPTYSTQTYSLSETFAGDTFFSDNFDYFTGYDPTSGHVHYVPAETAASYNLTYAGASSAVLRVDTSVDNDTVPNASTGRFSVRVTSKKQYGLNSLFVFDVKHSPMGCGTWPALWLTDPDNWPTNGEIDVMEAVNVIGDSSNQMTLHTSKGCSMKSVKRKETGKVLSTSCVNSTNGNEGCGVNAGEDTTFGSQFNTNGGGVLALELREAGIRMWQFARASIPADVWSSTPDPNTWGTATADFPNTECNIGNHFRNQSIVANIDLCGDWAGATDVYSENCPGNCIDYVSVNNTAFTNAYWEFGNFTIFSAA